MFVLCPHCQFLVALDPASGRPPARCPRCGEPVQPDAPATVAAATPAAPDAAPTPSPPAAAVGVDNDPQAILASHDNAERNGIADRLAVYLPADAPEATYPVVVANILASALEALAGTLAARVAPGGRLALSGILAGQEPPLLARYAEWFDALGVAREGDWVRIDGVRRG